MRHAHLEIEGLDSGVQLINCQSLEAILPTVLARLPHRIVQGEDIGRSFANIVSVDGMYRVHAPAIGNPSFQRDPVNAACEMAGLIARQMAHGRQDRLALHAAAIAVEAGLIVFPSGRRAGKSLLTVALAELGARVFGDDVLPIKLVPDAPIVGMALGISPRIRLPLPPTAAMMTERMARLPTAENGQYRYIAVPELAPAGEQLPIAAFVTLVPAEGAAPTLSATARVSTLRALLKQNFGRSVRADGQLVALHAMASTALSFELAYTDPSRSAAMIMSELVPQLRPISPLFSLETTGGTPQFNPAVSTAEPSYRRNDDAVMRELDGEYFAASADGARVLHFNEGMARIWMLLEEPASRTELIDALIDAFPDISPQRIADDVNVAVSELLAAGLIGPSNALES